VYDDKQILQVSYRAAISILSVLVLLTHSFKRLS